MAAGSTQREGDNAARSGGAVGPHFRADHHGDHRSTGDAFGDVGAAVDDLASQGSLAYSPDGSSLYAVNAGSNTIAVFNILDDGSLISVSGSPFSSDGQTPVSIGTKDNYIYVVNKAQDSVHKITTKPK